MALETHPHLYVEGKTDAYVILQLLKRRGLFIQDAHSPPPKTVPEDSIHGVIEYLKRSIGGTGSKTELFRDLEIRIKKPIERAIGYIFDADDPAYTGSSLEKTWSRIRQILSSLEMPDQIPAEGYCGVLPNTQTRIGIWLMPDNRRDGALENFLRDLMQANDVLIGHAEQSTILARAQFAATFEEKDCPKAILQAWLAWQEEPGMTYGTAFAKRCLHADAPLATTFTNWAKRLFNGDSRSDSPHK